MTKKLLLLMICAGNVAYMSAMDSKVQEKVSEREEELEESEKGTLRIQLARKEVEVYLLKEQLAIKELEQENDHVKKMLEEILTEPNQQEKSNKIDSQERLIRSMVSNVLTGLVAELKANPLTFEVK